MPFETEMASVFIRSQIESGNVPGASAVSVVLLAVSLLLLFIVSLFQRIGARKDPDGRKSAFRRVLNRTGGGGGGV